MKHIEGGRMGGRTVLVTGATSGIGRATALGPATMGADVAITGRDRERTDSAARQTSAAGGRNIAVASNAHAIGCIDFDDLQGERSYSAGRAYSQFKLANILFSYQLARRLRGSAVTANALHPGLVRTSFGAEFPARIQRLLVPLLRPVMKSTVQGAATSVHLASALELEKVSGQYFAGRRPTRSSTRSYDLAVAVRLWEASADLVSPAAAPRV